jgi:laminin alpha 3/5
VPCTCNQIGSENDACFAPCRCKFGYLGPYCDKCIDGYFGFPNCTECGCGEGRSSLNCDAVSGQCQCRQGYTGLKCGECENGYYSNSYGEVAGQVKASLMCSLCNCNQQGTTEEICSKDLSGVCLCKPNYTGERCDRCAEGFFGPQCEREFF